MTLETIRVKIDLGCGKRKQEGFVGIDRFPMPEVDILADIDNVLPLEDDSVDILFSSHSLEHVKDLMFTMREIYRVCKHGAQVCIIAPYNEQKLNIANPYHITVFNEHTPRFWTDYSQTPVDPEDYLDPVKRPWGLSKSDNSNPGLDIRLINMEFFYFPEYQYLPLDKKRKYRNERFNVCEQIMYQLIVWKGDEHSSDVNYSDHVSKFAPYEPHYIRHLKMREQEEIIQKFTQSENMLRQRIEDLKAQLAEAKILPPAPAPAPALIVPAAPSAVELSMERRINELTEDRALTERTLHDARTENHQLRLQIMGLFEKSEALNGQLHDANIQQMKSQLHTGQISEKILELTEQSAQLGSDLALSLERIKELESNLREAQSANQEVNAAILVLLRENQTLRDQLETVATIKAKNALMKSELVAANGIIDWYRACEITWNNEKNHLNRELLKVSQTPSPLVHEVNSLNQALNHAQQQADRTRHEAVHVIDTLHTEVSAYRSSRSLQMVSHYRGTESLWNLVSPAFASLKSYSKEHLLNTSRPVLILGGDLRNMPYREYLVSAGQNNLSVVSLAVRPLIRGTQGLIGIEVVSSNKEVVAQSVIALNEINPDLPTRFELPVPVALKKNWYLRIFVKEADVPVGLYEVCEYSIMKKRTKYSPFAYLQ